MISPNLAQYFKKYITDYLNYLSLSLSLSLSFCSFKTDVSKEKKSLKIKRKKLVV